MDVVQTLLAEELGKASPTDSFQYGPEPLGPDEIRVLVVTSDSYRDDQTDIHCHLVRMDLAATKRFGLERHPFLALSYVWGSETDKRTVFINGRRKEVTQNLYEALYHIRGNLAPVTLWVDAVCINQEDEDEKPLQLAKMTAIYRQAWTVIIWLGPADGFGVDIHKEAYQGHFRGQAEMLATVDDLNGIINKQEVEGKRQQGGKNAWSLSNDPVLSLALWSLFSLPLWTRVWIMQELVLAGSDAFMLWGREVISFRVMDELPGVREQFRPIDAYFDDSSVALTRFTMALQIIGLRFKEVRFLEALLAVRYRLASREHDYIYGLLGFVEGAHLIKPDYKKPIQDVFVEVFDVILAQETSLDILSACDRGWKAASSSRCGTEESSTAAAADGQEMWPTWLPDWAWAPIKQLKSDRLASFSVASQSHIRSMLLDSQDYKAVELKACGKRHAAAMVSRSGMQLVVRGIEFDSVKEIIGHEAGRISRTAHNGGSNSDFWVDTARGMWDRGLLREVYENLEVLKHACERTARYGHDTSTPTVNGPHMKAFEEAGGDQQHVEGGGGVGDDQPRAWQPFDDDEKIDTTFQTSEKSRFITYLNLGTSKSTYCVSRRGYVGRSPMPSQVGDLICVFYGGKVPFLLRPQATPGHYMLAGEIYVHGIMKGAAMEAMEDEAKDFILV